MSENKHTPEPWPVFSDIATTLTPDPEGAPAAILSWDDYIRARACVNACPGIETQDLEALRGTSILAKANASFDTVQKQRDELLADRDTWKARAEFSYQQRDVLEGRASLAEAQRDELLATLQWISINVCNLEFRRSEISAKASQSIKNVKGGAA